MTNTTRRQNLAIAKTTLPLEEFFKVLIFGYEIELKNRFLRIGHEYGSKVATAMADMHRVDVAKDVVKESLLTAIEEMAVKAILRRPKISSLELSKSLKVTQRQTQRIMAALKEKAGLIRRGGHRFGEWYFA